jgi:DNA-binding transcriptional MerR regulator
VQRLTIGAFSRLTHLSIKTLRYYHQVGLLEPADIDPHSGYRYYRPGQAQTAQLVRRFRDLGMPVAEVKAVLDAPDVGSRDAILAGHLQRMREQLRQTASAVDSLRAMLGGPPEPIAIDERTLHPESTISIAAYVMRSDVESWWRETLLALQSIAAQARLEQTGPAGGLYDDELFTEEKGQARIYLPVRDSPSLDDTALRWELPAGRFAVALYPGAHDDVDRTYTGLGSYAAAHGCDGAGPVRERYLVGPLDTPDVARWRTEICWPLTAPSVWPLTAPSVG